MLLKKLQYFTALLGDRSPWDFPPTRKKLPKGGSEHLVLLSFYSVAINIIFFIHFFIRLQQSEKTFEQIEKFNEFD